jgi:hypothetical protein
MGNPITKNYMTDGGDKWVIGGELVREAPTGLAGTFTGPMISRYVFAPAAVSAVAIHAAKALTASAQPTNTVTAQPDFPRNITIKGNAAGIAGDVVVTGKNILGTVITETIALNGSTEVLGTLAFATVTNYTLPAETHAGTDTVSIGRGKVFGMPHIIDNAGFLLVKLFNGSADTGTLAVDSDEIEKNVFSLNGTPDGSKIVDLVYLK